MFILNIYVTCILWERRERKEPYKPLQGAAFCPVTFSPSWELLMCCFTWEGFVSLESFPWCQLWAPWSPSLSAAVLGQKGAGLLHVNWQLPSHILHHFSLLCQLQDSMHSLNSDHALTLHQIWEQQGAAAQHWLFSWPDETSKGFQHRRDTSCGLGKQREIFPA